VAFTYPTFPPDIDAQSDQTQTVVALRGLTKSYGEPKHPAVSNVTLSVARGEILSLLGPSGCGKTTLLRLIAGFETPDGGSVAIGGREVANPYKQLPPEGRRVGFVFQDYALFPHLNVFQNVAFGLTGMSRAEKRERTREILNLVGLTVFSRRFPHGLSGGQQQRVALARALAPRPAVVLLDEPFSNLDAALRGNTRAEVRRILEASGATTVLVTHDQEEAMTFADRLAIMRSGKLEQLGPPEAVYKEPRTAFVASFLGTTNLLRGAARGLTAETPLGRVPLSRPAEGRVLLSLRPEDLSFHHEGVPVRVLRRDFKGHDLTYTCLVELRGGPQSLTVQTGPACPVRPGEVGYLRPVGRAVPLEGSPP